MTFLGTLDEVVNRRIDAAIRHPVLSSMMGGTIDHKSFVMWNTESFGYVRNTGNFLKQCARTCDRLSTASEEELNRLLGGRPLNGSIEGARAFFKEHAERYRVFVQGEDKHEQWILEDLEKIGADPALVRYMRSLPDEAFCPAVRALVGLESFTAHHNPIAAEGVGYFLEMLTLKTAATVAKNMKEKGIIPKIGETVFIKRHAIEDIGHVKDSLDVYGKIDNEKLQQELIATADLTGQYYEGLLEHIREQSR